MVKTMYSLTRLGNLAFVLCTPTNTVTREASFRSGSVRFVLFLSQWWLATDESKQGTVVHLNGGVEPSRVQDDWGQAVPLPPLAPAKGQ